MTASLYGWGSSFNGQLGLGNTETQTVPAKLLLPQKENPFLVSCGETSTFIVTEEKYTQQHKLYAAGLAKGITASNSWQTISLGEYSKIPIKSIKSGQYHTLVLLENGTVISFGGGKQGQLGHGVLEDLATPKVIAGLTDIVEIGCGWLHSMAINSKGELFTWGCSHRNQLGHDDLMNQSVPKLVSKLSSSHKIAKIAGGMYHTIGLTQEGVLFTLGIAVHHRTLIYSARSSSNITIHDFKKTKIIDISSGLHHSLALTENGEVYTWGGNEDGQLGDGTITPRNTFSAIKFRPSSATASLIGSGPFHNFAAMNNFSSHMWGLGSDFQCLPSSRTSFLTPQNHPFFAGEKVLSFAGGWAHSVALVFNKEASE